MLNLPQGHPFPKKRQLPSVLDGLNECFYVFLRAKSVVIRLSCVKSQPTLLVHFTHRMYRIIYISQATVPVGEYELESFLRRWYHNNEQDGITGILLYSDSEARFMQLIEGEKTVIRALFHHIEQDSRHCHLLKLADGPIAQRSFSSWLMGFRVVTVEEFKELTGYIEPDTPLFQQVLAQTQEPLVRELLLYFSAEKSHRL